jgi:threonine/homoserine/homoserine lactone efflux protein
VRLSRPRVLLRTVLLLVGAGFMAWKAIEAWQASGAAAEPQEAVLLSRIAMVEALVAALALAAAIVAALSLRARVRRRTLTLHDVRDPETPRDPETRAQ